MALNTGQGFFGAITGGRKPYPRGRRITTPPPGINPADYGPKPVPPRGWGGSGSLFGDYWLGDAIWDAFTGGNRRGTSNGAVSRPAGYPTGRAPRTQAEFEALRGQWTGNAVAPPRPSAKPYPIGRPEGRTTPFDTLYAAGPPAGRPNAQYYNANALRAAAPYATQARPGWYTPGEIDSFARTLGPDQLNALLPMIQAEAGRLSAPTGTVKPTWEAWLAGRSPTQQSWVGTGGGVLEDRLRAEYAAIPGQTPGLSNRSVWDRLRGAFPGIGASDNTFSNQVIPGFNVRRTPEQEASAAARSTAIQAGTYVPPGQASAPAGMEWFLNPRVAGRQGSGGYSLRRTAAPYRGGQLRR